MDEVIVGVLDEMDEQLKDRQLQEKQQDNLASFLAKYNKLKRAEQHAESLARKAEEEQEKQRKRREELKKARIRLAEAKQEMVLARRYAGVVREPGNKRQEHAAAGFFEIMNMCNDAGMTDFSDAYNFIADTAWLKRVVKECTNLFGEKNRFISINRLELRKRVFARRDEVQKLIDDAQILFESEWGKIQGKKEEAAQK
ncbi:MAG: hypothetical protein IJ709_12200 [Selenomonas sp.]|nr:hypothetical protein [Selenomonas sp.]